MDYRDIDQDRPTTRPRLRLLVGADLDVTSHEASEGVDRASEPPRSALRLLRSNPVGMGVDDTSGACGDTHLGNSWKRANGYETAMPPSSQSEDSYSKGLSRQRPRLVWFRGQPIEGGDGHEPDPPFPTHPWGGAA